MSFITRKSPTPRRFLLLLLAAIAQIGISSGQESKTPPGNTTGVHEADRRAAWVGQWLPADSQQFFISEDFRLHFSEKFPLPYLRGKNFELHLQEGDGSIGAEAVVEKRQLIFLIFPDDDDADSAWLIINRVDRIGGQRRMKVLLRCPFRRLAPGGPGK